MMLWALVASVAMAAPQQYGGRFSRVNERSGDGRSTRGLLSPSGPFFEFAPASGAGMGTACACAAVTGSKGETMTFARGSSGTCIKSSVLSVANGDVVTCSSNQPRVMPGGDGTGGLGILIEGATTNYVLRSQELDNAAWTTESSGAGLPTVTGNYATAPDNGFTAERLQIPATSAGQYSGIRPTATVITAGAWSFSVWLRGTSSAGATDLCMYNGTAYTCKTCSFASSSWTPCIVSTNSSAAGNMYIGNMTSLNGGTARSAVDILAWGVMGENSGMVTSYVASGGSPFTRAADSAYFAGSFPASNVGSMSVTTAVSIDTASVAYAYPMLASTSVSCPAPGSGVDQLVIDSPGAYGGSFRCYAANSTPAVFATGAVARPAYPANKEVHIWCATGATVTGAVEGTSMTASGATSGAFGAASCITIGGAAGGVYAGSVLKKICRDSSPSRCN